MNLPDDAEQLGVMAAQTAFRLLLTEAGSRVRQWLASLFGQGDARREAETLEQIDEDRTALESTHQSERDAVRVALAARWARRIAQHADADAAGRADVEAFLRQWAEAAQEAAAPVQVVHGKGHARQYVAGRDQHFGGRR